MGESTTDTLPHLCPLPLRGDFLWLVLGKQFCKYFLEKNSPLFTDPSLLPISSPLTLTSIFFFLLSYVVCFSFPTVPTPCFCFKGKRKKFLEKFFPYFPSSLFSCFVLFFLLLGKRGIKKGEWKKGVVCMLFLFFPPLMLRLVLLNFVFINYKWGLYVVHYKVYEIFLIRNSIF